mgnify:FL=1
MALYEAAQDVKSAIGVLVQIGTSELQQFADNNQGVVFTGLALGLVGVIGYGLYRDAIRRRVHKRLVEGQKMTKRERWRYIRKWFADKVTDILEDGEHQGFISRSEKLNLYRIISTLTGTRKELRPRKLTFTEQHSLKQHIVRLKNDFFHKHTPNIPGPKPGEDQKVVPLVPKNGFAEKFLKKSA